MCDHASSPAPRLLQTVLLIALLLSGIAVPVAFADGRTAGASVVRVDANDPLTPRHLARLRAASATARDLLERLEQIPDAIFLVRAHPRLAQSERAFGRGRFWLVRDRLYGFIEYQAEPVGSPGAERTLAHELAHALEIGMMPRTGGTRALRSLLQQRDREIDADPKAGIETDFAKAVAYRIHLELLGRLPNSTGRLAQAERSHVDLSPTIDANGGQ
jgi:hypothetical protein